MVIDETLMEPLSTSRGMHSSKILFSRFGSGVFSAKVLMLSEVAYDFRCC